MELRSVVELRDGAARSRLELRTPGSCLVLRAAGRSLELCTGSGDAVRWSGMVVRGERDAQRPTGLELHWSEARRTRRCPQFLERLRVIRVAWTVTPETGRSGQSY